MQYAKVKDYYTVIYHPLQGAPSSHLAPSMCRVQPRASLRGHMHIRAHHERAPLQCPTPAPLFVAYPQFSILITHISCLLIGICPPFPGGVRFVGGPFVSLCRIQRDHLSQRALHIAVVGNSGCASFFLEALVAPPFLSACLRHSRCGLFVRRGRGGDSIFPEHFVRSGLDESDRNAQLVQDIAFRAPVDKKKEDQSPACIVKTQ